MVKKVRVEDSVGLKIGHDMTKVIPGVYHGAAFKRGQVVKSEDVQTLLDMGKKYIFVEQEFDVEQESDGLVHEEDAARRLAIAFAGPGLRYSDVKQGRIDIISNMFGLLKIDLPLLKEINSIDNIVLATRHDGSVIEPDMVVAGTKIVPLFIEESSLSRVEEICSGKDKVLQILPFKLRKIGVVVTGSEVYSGRKKDGFGDVIKQKVQAFGGHIEYLEIVDDDENMISRAIITAKNKGCEAIMVCGGLAVDPDDITVTGLKKSGAEIISHGTPVIPGAMFTLAEIGNIPVIGVPALVLVFKSTILDVILPRILAGHRITKEEIKELGHGGLCLDCSPCLFPVCPFCK